MFVCEVCLACALYFFFLFPSCLRNLIVYLTNTAITTTKNIQTADKRATTGKLASFGQLLALLDPITEIEVELCVVLVVEEVVDSVGLATVTVVDSQGTVH